MYQNGNISSGILFQTKSVSTRNNNYHQYSYEIGIAIQPLNNTSTYIKKFNDNSSGLLLTYNDINIQSDTIYNIKIESYKYNIYTDTWTGQCLKQCSCCTTKNSYDVDNIIKNVTKPGLDDNINCHGPL